MWGKMDKYIFKEQKIKNEYKYVFLCGSYYDKKNHNDKRKVLRRYLEETNENIKAIILEENFVFGKDSKTSLVYDDIHMKDLYQVEMLMNYLSDNILIIHESISTGAETGLFLSEEASLDKTCLLIPDRMAVEEDKLGQFLRLAFTVGKKRLKIIEFYPRIESNVTSENVRRWHTYFYDNVVGETLGNRISGFLKNTHGVDRIKFAKKASKTEQGEIYYKIKGEKLEIVIKPRVLLTCIAALFNIDEVEKDVFSGDSKSLGEYIQGIKTHMERLFINTIEEKSGAEISSCSIIPKLNVKEVYIGKIIGMCLYLFQAANFIEIKKDKDYPITKKVSMSRKVISENSSEAFFYHKYRNCIQKAIDIQIG